MNDTYSARVLADSYSPSQVRLTTLEVTFPRFILAEINTHRALSRNSASSRAIPTEKQIQRVTVNPFIPETFNKRVKGMGVGDELDEVETARARYEWLKASKHAVIQARRLNGIGLDKSRVNRLLEPFLWHTAIISATEWDNFFGLRDHPEAQPEFQIVAKLMREAIANSDPVDLEYGQWHLPLVTPEELSRLSEIRQRDEESRSTDAPMQFTAELEREVEMLKLISAGRCARVSYDTQHNWESPEASIERAERLKLNGHFSPFEHVARPISADDYPPVPESMDIRIDGPLYGNEAFCGNFRGWLQMRKEIPYESNFLEAIEER